jgi:hypothetical protein
VPFTLPSDTSGSMTSSITGPVKGVVDQSHSELHIDTISGIKNIDA